MTDRPDDHLGPLNGVAAAINAGEFEIAASLLDFVEEVSPEITRRLDKVVAILRDRIVTKNRGGAVSALNSLEAR